MQYLTRKKIKDVFSKDLALLFDFDGVLSAIAPTPEDAFLLERNKRILEELCDILPVAIITGRDTDVIKGKVGLNKIFYVASHGLEWEEDGVRYFKEIPREMKDGIEQAKKMIKPLLERYPGMIFENKPFSFGVHYRIMNSKLINSFKKEVLNILNPIVKSNNLKLDHNKKTFELRPNMSFDKGSAVIFTLSYFQKKYNKTFKPLYVGDALTDEDAFLAVNSKNGLSVRVRPKKDSVAKYYFKSRKEVDGFLSFLVELFK